MHESAAYGIARLVRAHLRSGSLLDAKDPAGRTALMLSAAFGNEETVRALVDGGADALATDPEGRTALDYAEKYAPSQPLAVLLGPLIKVAQIDC